MILYTPVPMDMVFPVRQPEPVTLERDGRYFTGHPQRERGADHPALLHLPGRLSPGGLAARLYPAGTGRSIIKRHRPGTRFRT